MPQKPRICSGFAVENPGPTVFLYANGYGPVTFPRTSLNLSKVMATNLSDCEEANFLDADLETLQCIATYMTNQTYVCPAGLTPTSPVSVYVASFKAALNVVAHAAPLDLPDLVKQAEEVIDKTEDNIPYTLALQELIDSGGAMNFSDLMPRIEETARNIVKYAPANRYGPLLDTFGVPDTWGKLYLMTVLSTMAEGERKDRALELICEGLITMMPRALKKTILSRYFGIEYDEQEDYDRYELVDLQDVVDNADDGAGVADSRRVRRARRAEQEIIRPQKLKRGKQARASQIRRIKNGARV
ncbi:uncharacterized protein FTOL_02702 [Fusarium torulosum]|uniref:Uncharacterized protein n=1 Tax=Fusarium torulosum TaxID=33205 RepID=A0AAE8SEN1_9HYPO|nr:uncharacterized protein FTOL_02702 [Fusarium torulosum]